MTTVVGQNGLFSRTKNAKTATEIAHEKEVISTSYMAVESGNADADVKLAELNSEINSELNGETATVEGKDNGPFYITYNKSGRQYTIDATGKTEETSLEKANGKGDLGISDGADGSASKPYTIQSIEDLCYLSYLTNNTTGIINLSATANFSLLIDLDFNYPGSYIAFDKNTIGSASGFDVNGNGSVEGLLNECTSGNGWNPIGTDTNKFAGIISSSDSNIHKIINLYSKQNGLIAIASDISVKNLELKDVNINCNTNDYLYKAALIGFIDNANQTSIFQNCTVSGNMTYIWESGGMIGFISNLGTLNINNCNNYINVSKGEGYNGGLIGYSSDFHTIINIDNCNNYGRISGKCEIGGIIGFLRSPATINNCNNYGSVSSLINGYAGGIVGRDSKSTLDNCTNSGEISGRSSIGGIVGEGAGGASSFYNCKNSGHIIGQGSLGGICGGYSQVLQNCINFGDITIKIFDSSIDSYTNAYRIGGIGGSICNSIKNCANFGNITTEGLEDIKINYVGGIIGDNNVSILNNCYNKGNISISAKSVDDVYGIASVYDTNNSNNFSNNCYNTGNINITINNGTTTTDYIGGIFGCSQKINNCYNMGKININSSTSNKNVESISAYSYSAPSNCFYLKDSYTYGYYSYVDSLNHSSETGVCEEVADEATMKAKIVAYLKTQDGWTEDTNNINDGYPIFTWQK